MTSKILTSGKSGKISEILEDFKEKSTKEDLENIANLFYPSSEIDVSEAFDSYIIFPQKAAESTKNLNVFRILNSVDKAPFSTFNEGSVGSVFIKRLLTLDEIPELVDVKYPPKIKNR